MGPLGQLHPVQYHMEGVSVGNEVPEDYMWSEAS